MLGQKGRHLGVAKALNSRVQIGVASPALVCMVVVAMAFVAEEVVKLDQSIELGIYQRGLPILRQMDSLYQTEYPL